MQLDQEGITHPLMVEIEASLSCVDLNRRPSAS